MKKKVSLVYVSILIGILILFSTTGIGSQDMKLLSVKEAGTVIGSANCACKIQTGSCYDYVTNCVLPGQECSSVCKKMGLQNAKCGFQLFGGNCVNDPPIDCGMKQWGTCDANKNCIYSGTAQCGTVTACHGV